MPVPPKQIVTNAIIEMETSAILEPELPYGELAQNSQVPNRYPNSETLTAELVASRSWPFRIWDFANWLVGRIFGLISILTLLAFAANVPILQFAVFGYLLEASGRIARSGRLRDGLFGLGQATHVVGLIAGVWICLLPVRFVSDLWYSAWLIDENSTATQTLRVLQIILTILTVCHILAAVISGGKLRQFFWPIIAPFEVGLWGARRSLNWPFLGSILTATVGRVAPNFLHNLRAAKPLADWFLPLVFWNKIRRKGLVNRLADDLWDFAASLRLPYLTWFGFKGVVGSLCWLLLPSLLLISATSIDNGLGVLLGLVGGIAATMVFSVLLYLQTHFAIDGRFGRFLEIWKSFGIFRRAPLWHLFAGLLSLVFALPLFLLKIEVVPAELLWTLSLVFVLFSWPARLALGYAYGRGRKRAQMRAWWWSLPLACLVVPLCFAFVLIFFFTQYTSWNGPVSLFENHVFLLPAPFWLDWLGG